MEQHLSQWLDVADVRDGWLKLFALIPHDVYAAAAAKLQESDDTYSSDLQTFPPRPFRLHCFRFFPPTQTRVVILGQDPYIAEGQAMGLAFSVPPGVALPPSLKIVVGELRDDVGQTALPRSGDLTWWAHQGVLLLNTSLTVLEGISNSHKKVWATWTTHFLRVFSQHVHGVVFLLWGGEAKAMKVHIAPDMEHVVIEGAHPSPLARGAFKGGRYFSRANAALEGLNKSPINWLLKI
jgi:uracil-DNA glycosylase